MFITVASRRTPFPFLLVGRLPMDRNCLLPKEALATSRGFGGKSKNYTHAPPNMCVLSTLSLWPILCGQNHAHPLQMVL